MQHEYLSWRAYGTALSIPPSIGERLWHAMEGERPVGGSPDIFATPPPSAPQQAREAAAQQAREAAAQQAREAAAQQEAEWLERLVASGIVQPGPRSGYAAGQSEIPRDPHTKGPRVGPLAASVLDALIEERQEGR